MILGIIASSISLPTAAALPYNRYIFDESSTSYMTTTYDCDALTGNFTVAWKGKWCNDSTNTYNTAIGFTNGEISLGASDAIYISFTGLTINGGWTNDGLEHTFVLVVDESNGHVFYVDGTSEATAAASAVSFAASSFFEIGAWRGATETQHHLGELEYVYLYDRAFTAQEIIDINADITDIPSTNKVLAYQDNKSLAAWEDESGNGYDATNAGAVELIGLGYTNDGGLDTALGVDWTIDYPTTVNEDDILIMVLLDKSANVTIPTPSGWTLIETLSHSSGLISTGVYWKRAVGTESGSVTVSNSGANSYGVMYAVEGAIATETPIENVDSLAPALGLSVTHSNSNLPSVDRSLSCMIYVNNDDDDVVDTSTGYIEQSNLGTSVGSDCRIILATERLTDTLSADGSLIYTIDPTARYTLVHGFMMKPAPSTGEEIYPQNNAASIWNEVNGVGAWDVGGATVASVGSGVITADDGDYCIEGTSVGTGSQALVLTLAASEVGATYNVSIAAAKGAGITSPPRFNIWEGFSNFSIKYIESTTFTTHTWTLTGDGNPIILRVYWNDSTAGQKLYIDSISIKKQ